MINNSNKIIFHRLKVGPLETNCYIFGCAKTKKVAIIDPGANAESIQHLIDSEELQPIFIINTHGHLDHIGANKDFNLPVYIHEDDAVALTNPDRNLSGVMGCDYVSQPASMMLADGDVVEIGEVSLKVMHIPGHTPGGIALLYDKLLLSGDSLFQESIGRTDLPYGNNDDLIKAINNKLMKLDDDVVVYPGHGEKTTIGHERKNNHWL
ncbi:MAG: MBL fold metallo-hydrolase [Candidatus Omnitrophota bacterium]